MLGLFFLVGGQGVISVVDDVFKAPLTQRFQSLLKTSRAPVRCSTQAGPVVGGSEPDTRTRIKKHVITT